MIVIDEKGCILLIDSSFNYKRIVTLIKISLRIGSFKRCIFNNLVKIANQSTNKKKSFVNTRERVTNYMVLD